MITVAAMAKEQDLSDREMLAVCRLAGIEATRGSDMLTSEQSMLVRDVLAGRVIPKAPRKRVQVPTGRLVVAGLIAVVMGGALFAVISAVSGPARVTVMAGDCFNEPPIFGATLDPVPCGGPHKYRAFARMELGAKFGDVYPGEDVAKRHVENRCEAHRGAAGSEDMFGTVAIYYFLPDEGAWERGARAAICATRNW